MEPVTRCLKGYRYAVEFLHFYCFHIPGDESYARGYVESDWFDESGRYSGPSSSGMEPLFTLESVAEAIGGQAGRAYREDQDREGYPDGAFDIFTDTDARKLRFHGIDRGKLEAYAKRRAEQVAAEI